LHLFFKQRTFCVFVSVIFVAKLNISPWEGAMSTSESSETGRKQAHRAMH